MTRTKSSAPTNGPSDVSPDAASGDANGVPDGSSLSDDETFDLLRNERRRETLRYLETNDGRATLDEVAENIAAKENDTTVEELTSDQRKRVYVGLYQNHMSKLDDAGVVDYDKDRGTIRITPAARQLLQYLDVPPVEVGSGGEPDAPARGTGPDARPDRETGDDERADSDRSYPGVVPGAMGAAVALAASGGAAEAGLATPGIEWVVLGVIGFLGTAAISRALLPAER